MPILYKDFFITLKTEVSKMANQNKNTGGCYILLLTSVLKVSNSYNIGASAAVLVTKWRRSGRTTAERLALIGCRNDVINYTANQYCGQLALPRLCSCVGHRPTRILEMNLNYFGTFLCTLNLHEPLSKGAKEVLIFLKSAQQVFKENYIIENNTSI